MDYQLDIVLLLEKILKEIKEFRKENNERYTLERQLEKIGGK